MRTSLHSVRRGRREVKGSALPSAFLFLPGDASLSASAARAPCKAARPLRAYLFLLGIVMHQPRPLSSLMHGYSISADPADQGLN